MVDHQDMRVYWWNAKPNFGDALTPFLVERFTGVTVQWAAPPHAQAVIVGSVIDVLPTSWTGIIAGAGKLHEHSTIPSGAHILGLRGHLTAEGIPGDYAIGDPALLVDELIPPQEKLHDLGIVPHWTDQVLARKFNHLNTFVINPLWDPLRVITEISRCKRIVASSLHGIVVADAFGIPRRAEMFPAMNNKYEGGTFKFEDYSSGINFPMQFGVLQEPPRGPIERAQYDLFEMLRMDGTFDAEN